MQVITATVCVHTGSYTDIHDHSGGRDTLKLCQVEGLNMPQQFKAGVQQ